jgi:sugar fermentation stimulation protein
MPEGITAKQLVQLPGAMPGFLFDIIAAMKFDFEFLPVELIGRTNRFTAHVLLNGKKVRAHIPTSGRLTELLVPGNRCYIRRVESDTRVTPYDLLLIEYKGHLVHINAIAVNKLMAEAIRENHINEFKGYDVRPEYTWGNSRFDLYLTKSRCKPVLMEIKSVTLCEDGIGLFPDAPTKRGVKHLLELRHATREGYRAYSVFVAQRSDAREFRPNWETDPEFSETLREVSRDGVNVRAYRCDISLDEMTLSERLPVYFK